MTTGELTEVQRKIQRIIENRSRSLGPVLEMKTKWTEFKRNLARLKGALADLDSKTLSAIKEGDPNIKVFEELKDVLTAIKDEGTVDALDDLVTKSLKDLGKLEQRFDRKTINIAVAGVGRSGKSTSLKSIIGKPQSDNSVIPSGDGEAVTAGKSTIESVASKSEEGTTVTFHTEESFLSEVVNPILEGTGFEGCTRGFEFENLDIDKHIKELETKFSGGALNANKAQLETLRKIQRAYPSFEAELGPDPREVKVSLEETWRYVSYPKGLGEKFLCYAVKDCHIRTVFPNNEVTSIQLVDLPGLGTNSIAEKRCFKDGFNYAVDLALMVRRPTALFMNYPADDDQGVINVLCDTFGEEHLAECMVLFQNDANLSAADEAMIPVDKSNAERQSRGEQPITVIRGDAMNADFMQKQLMPKLLEFITDKLPQLDEAFCDEILPREKGFAEDFETKFSEIKKRLDVACRKFPRLGGSAADYERKRREIVNGFVNETNQIINTFGVDFKKSETNLEANLITDLTSSIREWIDKTYNLENVEMIKLARQRYDNDKSVIPFLMDNFDGQVHALQNKITEVYAGLDRAYDEIVRKMKKDIVTMLTGMFEGVIRSDVTLGEIVEKGTISSQCPNMAQALRNVSSLEVRFYDYIFPDINAQVFSKITDSVIAERFKIPQDKSSEEKAKYTVYTLCAFGHQLVKDIESMLYEQCRISDIICAAMSRLQNSLARDREVGDEIINFVQANWDSLQTCKKSRGTEVRQMVSHI